MEKPGFLSIIVLNYNMKGLIKKALDSINSSDYPKSKYEVIDVDNHSTDGSDEYIEQNYPDVTLIRNKKNTGFAGMNVGLEAANGEYVFFVSNDAVLASDCISKLMDAITTLPDDVAGVSPFAGDTEKKEIDYHYERLSRSFYTCSIMVKKPEKYYETAFSGIPICKKRALQELGTFIDPDYFLYGEDVDFSYRLRMIGYRVISVLGGQRGKRANNAWKKV